MANENPTEGILHEELMEALWDERILDVINLIGKGADIHMRDTDHTSLLDIAVLSGNTVSIQILIKAGMSLLEMHYQLFEQITEANRLDILEVLLYDCPENYDKYFGMSVHFQTHFTSPLHWAIKFRKLDIMKFLVKKGFPVNRLCEQTRMEGRPDVPLEYFTPLNYAAKTGDVEMAQMLLDLGADVYHCFAFAEGEGVPFTTAVQNGHMDLAMKLIPKDVNAPNPSKENQIDGIDDRAFSFLFYAAYSESVKGVQMLVEKCGGDPTKAVNNYLPIHMAMLGCQQDIIDYLYPLSDFNLHQWDAEQLRIILHTCLDTTGRYLSEKGFRLKLGDQDLLSFLLDMKGPGAVNKVVGHRETPLMMAIRARNSHHIKVALQCGADPNLPHGTKYPLWYVVSSNQISCVQALIEANPDMAISKLKCYDGWVPWDCDRKLKMEDGSEMRISDTTTMQEALFKKNPEIITLCVEAGCSLWDSKDMLDLVRSEVTPHLKPHIIDLIEKYDSSLRSLQHLAKFAVRRCLGHRDVEARIDTLPLAEQMKKYVKHVGL